MAQRQEIPNGGQAWLREGLTRVPYRVFQTEEAYKSGQNLIFQGPSWHYLALEVEVPEPRRFPHHEGWRHAGDRHPRRRWRDLRFREPLRASRRIDLSGQTHGKGKKAFSCVYHAWTYDRKVT